MNRIARINHWFAHRIVSSHKYPISVWGGRVALYAWGWDITTNLFTVVYANFGGKRTLHVESRNGSGTVLLWANKRMYGARG